MYFASKAQMTSPLDISEIFTRICSFLDLEELINLTQLDSDRRHWIKTFPWSHIVINIRSIAQLTHFITNYNFKCYYLTPTFFSDASDHYKLLLAELNNDNKLFVETFLSSRIIIKTSYMFPYDLCWFYLNHSYSLDESNASLDLLIFSRNKIHTRYTKTTNYHYTDTSDVMSFNTIVKCFKSCTNEMEKRTLLCACKKYTDDFSLRVSCERYQRAKSIIDEWNNYNCDNLFLHNLFDCIRIPFSEEITLLPKLHISICDLNTIFLDYIANITGFDNIVHMFKIRCFLSYLLLADKTLITDSTINNIISNREFVTIDTIDPVIHLFTNMSVRSFVWYLICNHKQLYFFSDEAAKRLRTNIGYVKYAEMPFVVEYILENKDYWRNLRLVNTLCEHGNLEALKYIHDNHQYDDFLSTYDHLAFENIVKHNHHHILKWWIYCEWPIKVRKTKKMYRMIFAGQIETFKILLQWNNIIPFVFSTKEWKCAYNRPKKFYRYITEHKTDIDVDTFHIVNLVDHYVLSGVAEAGNVKVLSTWYKYLIKKMNYFGIHTQSAIEKIFGPQYHSFIEYAIQYDNLDIIKWWIRRLPIYYTCDAFNLACNLGHMNIVEYFLKNMQKKVRSKHVIESNTQINGKWTKPFVLLYTMQGLTRICNVGLLYKMIKIWKDNDLLYGDLTPIESHLKKKFNLDQTFSLF